MARSKGVRTRKAQGLSMNVIIIAAIALIVLLVLSFVLFGRFKIFGQGLQSCKGTCEIGGCPEGRVSVPADSGCSSEENGNTVEPAEGRKIFCCIKPF